jgi:uncharacterized protein (DUF2141 family)
VHLLLPCWKNNISDWLFYLYLDEHSDCAALKLSVKIFISFFFSVSSIPMFAQSLDIRIENIRSSEGTIFLAFFRDNASFLVEKPFMIKKFCKQSLASGCLSVCVEMEPGLYGIALLDDENKDDKMEYNWLGIPREGFGFSDFYAKGFKRPVFSDFDFILTDSNKIIHIVIRYIL